MKGNKCKRGRNSKEKLTVLLAASDTGQKLPAFVIGEENEPRYFKNVNVKNCHLSGDQMKWHG
jgi:hypothetical protein